MFPTHYFSSNECIARTLNGQTNQRVRPRTRAARVIAPAALPASLRAPLAGVEVVGVVEVVAVDPAVPVVEPAVVPVPDVVEVPVRVALAVVCNTVIST